MPFCRWFNLRICDDTKYKYFGDILLFLFEKSQFRGLRKVTQMWKVHIELQHSGGRQIKSCMRAKTPEPPPLKTYVLSIHSAECNSWPMYGERYGVRRVCCMSGFARFPSSSTTLATGWTLNRTTCCICCLCTNTHRPLLHFVSWFYTHNPRTSYFHSMNTNCSTYTKFPYIYWYIDIRTYW